MRDKKIIKGKYCPDCGSPKKHCTCPLDMDTIKEREVKTNSKIENEEEDDDFDTLEGEEQVIKPNKILFDESLGEEGEEPIEENEKDEKQIEKEDADENERLEALEKRENKTREIPNPLLRQPKFIELIKNRPAIVLPEIKKEIKEVPVQKEIRKEVVMAENKSSKEEEITLVEVPTQTTVAFRLADGRVVDDRTLLVEIYKEIRAIKESVA